MFVLLVVTIDFEWVDSIKLMMIKNEFNALSKKKKNLM